MGLRWGGTLPPPLPRGPTDPGLAPGTPQKVIFLLALCAEFFLLHFDNLLPKSAQNGIFGGFRGTEFFGLALCATVQVGVSSHSPGPPALKLNPGFQVAAYVDWSWETYFLDWGDSPTSSSPQEPRSVSLLVGDDSFGVILQIFWGKIGVLMIF